MTKKNQQQSYSFLIGIGLDATDDHVRITRGPGFGILGGSQETHGLMQEKVLKIHSTLQARQQSIADLDLRALTSLIQELESMPD